MKMSDLKTVLTAMVKARKRVLIVGAPGLGKTALVKQVRDELQAEMTTLYASVSDPTDFKGFYCIIDGKPEIIPFGELDRIYNATSLHIVFLDDLGLAVPAVQGAAMSFLDRVKDNPNICVIGATNRREDRAGVSGLLEPVKSRFDSIIHAEFCMDAFTEWSLEQVDKGKMPIELVAFNKFRPHLMYSEKATPDLKNGPCPRTVAALGEMMMLGIPEQLEFETYSGAVGEGYVAELLGFLPIWRKLHNIDTILTNPDAVELPKPTDKYAPSIFFAICGALARKASENTIDRILKFSKRIPDEFSVCLLVDCVKHDPNIQNTSAYIRWHSENKHIMI